MKLSVIIISKNEEKNIRDCLESVAFADEIILVDDDSSDTTVSLAKNLGAQVFMRKMNDDWAAQQNFAIRQATGDWLLLLDCDERISSELATEIRTLITKEKTYAYQIKRLNHFAKHRVRFGTLRSDWVCRLLPNQSIHFEGLVHPQLIHSFDKKKLTNPMIHYTYESWTQYYKKFEQYTRLAALQYNEQGKQANFFRDLWFRPSWAFFKMYVIHGGFLDGKIGWLLAINHCFYTLTKYSRLFAIQNQGDDTL